MSGKAARSLGENQLRNHLRRWLAFFVSPVRWCTGHCHWIWRLTHQSKFFLISQGKAPRNNTHYNTDLWHVNRKYLKKRCQKRYCTWIFFTNHHEIVNCQKQARNSRKQLASWERCDGRSWPKVDFYRVSLYVLTRQELLSTRTSIVVIPLLKSIIDDQLSEIL